MDDALWQAASPAIEEMIDAAHTYMDGGGWCLEDDVPTVSHEHHWPWLTVERWGDGRPKKWSNLLGKRESRPTHIAVEELPAYQAFLTHARSREDLRGKLLPPEDMTLDWLNDMMLDHLSLGVFERAMHLGAKKPRDFLSLYCEAEKSILADDLRGSVVIPLAFAAFPHGWSVQLDDRTRIRPLTDDEHCGRAPAFPDRAVPQSVINAATHAIILDDVVVDNRAPWDRKLGRKRYEETAIPQERIDRTIRSLRVASPGPFGYAQILLAPNGWADHWRLDLPPLVTIDIVRRYPPSLDQRSHRESVTPPADHDLANIAATYAALGRGDKRLNLAARRLDLATHREEPDDTVLDVTVGVEALLGGDRNEIAHRIATRAAVLLRDSYHTHDVYSYLKKVYDRRSEIVHGSQSMKNATIRMHDLTLQTEDVALWLLRTVIAATIALDGPLDPVALDRTVLALIDQSARPAD